MFCIQDNQYFSPAVPGTREKLNEILDSPQVRWKIETIRQLRQPGAIKVWGSNSEYQKFCIKEGEKKKTGEAFKSLTDEEKLVRFATSLKESKEDEAQGAGRHPPQRSVYVRRGSCGQPA